MTWTTQPRSDFGQLAAIRAGAGPQVLLIHGVGLRAEAWGAQIEALAQNCDAIAVDMPGHGHSVLPRAPTTLAAFTDVIAETITGSTVVIGHSFGAMIALDMAIRHPEKVRALAALNAVYRRDAAAKSAVLARAARLDGLSVPDPAETLVRWFGTEPSPARDACHDWLCRVDPAGYRAAYLVFAKQDGPSEQDLRTLGCPALFLTGADEPNSTPAMSERMAELCPRGRSKILQNAAHMLPMTHAPQTNEILKRFVEEHAHDAD